MKRTYIFLFAIIIISCNAAGQGRNATWCFGDSAGVQFTSGGIVGITSALQAHEASASISDTLGNLLFYAGRQLGGYYSDIFNNQNQILYNGDSLVATSSITQGLLILASSLDTSRYLLFSLGFVPNIIPKISLILTEVDMSQNGGTGAVIFKNQIIDSTINHSEKMIAIKHGNGKDWWLINHLHNSDQFVIRLIQNDSIKLTLFQNIGSVLGGLGWGQMTINPSGDKIVVVDYSGLLEVYDFNRCSGNLTNYIDMSDFPLPGFDRYYGASISPENILYFSTLDSLWQIDLNAANPIQTKQLVYADQNGNACMGQHQLGPNGKIYIANAMPCGYPSTITDSLNTHLTVIDQPDSIGLACNVLPYFQLIGGARSYLGLPNMPNYSLGPLVGSPCDTLTSIHSNPETNYQFEIIPNPVVSEFKVSLSGNIKSENYFELRIFNSKGQIVYQNINYKLDNKIICSSFSAGLYAIQIIENGQPWYIKFIKL